MEAISKGSTVLEPTTERVVLGVFVPIPNPTELILAISLTGFQVEPELAADAVLNMIEPLATLPVLGPPESTKLAPATLVPLPPLGEIRTSLVVVLHTP